MKGKKTLKYKRPESFNVQNIKGFDDTTPGLKENIAVKTTVT